MKADVERMKEKVESANRNLQEYEHSIQKLVNKDTSKVA
jgi:hypothetical protein